MDRRWTGAMTLLLAVTLALVGPGIGGRGVRGEAGAAVLPGAPAVGDCLLRTPVDPSVAPGLLMPAVDPVIAELTDSATLPAVTVPAFGAAAAGRCTGPVLGEVVEVLTDRDAVTVALTQTSGADRDARCRDAAVEYVGLRSADPATSEAGATRLPGPAADASPLEWSPALPIEARWVGPDRLRRQVGQLWMACVLTPDSEQPYRGTARATFGTGAPPPALGLCWPVGDLDSLPRAVDCAGPHRGQLMAVGSLPEPDRADFTAVHRSCREVVSRLMLRADPEASGDLVVRTDPAEPPPTRRFTQGPVTVACFVASADGRELDGSVMGLGESAVRYAG